MLLAGDQCRLSRLQRTSQVGCHVGLPIQPKHQLRLWPVSQRFDIAQPRCHRAKRRWQPNSRRAAAADRSACSRSQVSSAPLALPLADLASDVIYEPTGVPILDELMDLGSVSAAGWQSARLLVVLGAAALLGMLALRAVDSREVQRIDAAGSEVSMRDAALAAAVRPCRRMLPVYCSVRALTVALAMGQVWATKEAANPLFVLLGRISPRLVSSLRWLALAAGGDNTRARLCTALKWAAQIAQDCSELVLVVTAAWFAMDLNHRLISRAIHRLQTDPDVHKRGVVPLLRLLSTAVDIVISLAATAVSLIGFGFHIGPLVASIGGVGVVVGLSTQTALSNIAAAVTLYSSRPFVTGDSVQLINPRGVTVSGTVLNIEPTRTVLRDDESGCIVHIGNSDVSQYIIRNSSQYRELHRLRELQQKGSEGSISQALQEVAVAMRSTTCDDDEEEQGGVERRAGGDGRQAPGGAGTAWEGPGA